LKKEKEPLQEEKDAAPIEYEEPVSAATSIMSLTVAQLNIKDKFPEQVAVLHVQMDGKDMFRLIGANTYLPLDVRQQDKPPRSLGELIEQGIAASEIRNTFIDYSPSVDELCGWLLRLLDRYGSELKLIIIDHTDFEIPWELIDLQERRFVGAMIATSRWLKVKAPGAGERTLPVVGEECAGRTLSCYLYQEIDHHQIESNAVGRLDAQSTDDLQHFFKMLCCRDADVGMVLVSSHAFFKAGRSREISVGSRANSKNRLPLSAFRETELKVIKESRPIVFLNGCDSARVTFENERFVSSYRRGFPEVFLAKGARGFIGTLAAVKDDHAAEFARDFIIKALERPDLPVATLLRELRAEAAARLPRPVPEEAEALKFLNTFMYVYYGSPLTSLRLKVKEA
jgi:hypothetical protein